MIAVENLSKIYDSGSLTVTALREVSFQIQKGEFVAIMSHSWVMRLRNNLPRVNKGKQLSVKM